MRAKPRSQQLFLAALGVTVGLAFLPSRYLRPWTSDLSGIVNLPITPLSHAGSSVRGFLRPASGPALPASGDMGVLTQQLAQYEQMYDSARLRIRELETQLEQLQQLPIADVDYETRMRSATVIGRDPTSIVGLVELNRGARHGVNLTAIAVYGSGYLLGRVTQVEPLRSQLRPIAHEESGSTIRAAIIWADRPMAIDEAPEIQLEPQPDGTFRADIATEHDVAIGDAVKLTDPRWPAAALGRLIGQVEHIERNDLSPLREVLHIRPYYQASQVSRVTLLFEVEPPMGGPEP